MNELHLIDTGDCSHGRAVMVLEQPYVYEYSSWPWGSMRMKIVVPRGFETDFATIPRFVWWLLPPTGPWRGAAVIHDWLCTIKCPRFLTDAIFRHVMWDHHVALRHRIVIYYGVRAYWVLWGGPVNWIKERMR